MIDTVDKGYTHGHDTRNSADGDKYGFSSLFMLMLTVF